MAKSKSRPFFPALLFLCAAWLSAQSAPGAANNISMITVHEGETVTLPENPQPQPHRRAGFWTFRAPDDPILRTNREFFHDRTWEVTQSVWLAAIVFDAEATHQGLAHHNCVEGNIVGDPHPSRKELYLNSLPEYAAGTAFNYVAMRLVGKPLIFEFPGGGIVSHVRGGSAWIRNCW
jgi:hypothetical protein